MLAGVETSLEEYAHKVLLVVNTASACGLTPQYEQLEYLYRQYADRGFAVLGFPCNQFGGQEPGSAEQIASFCSKNYGVSFPIFAKIDINGQHAHPLYQSLKQERQAEDGTEDIQWNFAKFLISRNGQVLARYAPTTAPDSLAGDIEKALV